jgi:hypothetical protein
MTRKKSKIKPKTGDDVLRSLGKMFETTYENYADRLIFKISDYYVIYDQYVIHHDKNTDVYQVTRRRDDFMTRFNYRRMALLWSILDLNRYFYQADRIKMLDKLLSTVEIEKNIHTRLLNRNVVVYSNKIQSDVERNKKYNTEINKYIQLVNKLQKRNS